jgi:hypothetical protein
MAAPSMNAIAEKYASKGVGSIFLYTHEAHPAENMPHLTSMEQKYRHAQLLRDELGVSRPIVLDSLDGACHRAYGSNPNMTWIFSRSGQILYKSDWTDAHSVDSAIAYYLEVIARRRAGERMTTFLVERLDFREHDREKFDEGLARNGPKAVSEFQAAFPR